MDSFLALLQIVLIDLSLTGDNALVVGMVAADLPPSQRKRAMIVGLAVATGLRIVMALFAVQLLRVAGLLAAGGVLLLWVCWKMWRELHVSRSKEHGKAQTTAKRFSDTIWQIIIADFSMSLDNTLGVAGVARGHRWELVVGLCLSIGLMGLASAQIAKLAARYPKIGYLAIAIVLYVALHMIYDGAQNLIHPIHALV